MQALLHGAIEQLAVLDFCCGKAIYGLYPYTTSKPYITWSMRLWHRQRWRAVT